MKQFPLEPRLFSIPVCLLLAFSSALLGQQNPPANPPTQTEQQPTPTPSTPEGQAKPSGGASRPAGGAPVDSNSYKVGPSDVLYVDVWGQPAFTGPYAVQQNGNITVKLLGDVSVGGKTPIEIQDILGKALTKYVVRPLVTVTVSEVGSKKYYMDGLVAHPGEYALVAPISILEAISKAGGLQDFANSKHIYILRGTQRIYFNYKDVLRGKHMEQNIEIKPGDHIVVP